MKFENGYMTTCISEEAAATMQFGKTNVTFREILEEIKKVEERVALETLSAYLHAPIVLSDGPNPILGPTR